MNISKLLVLAVLVFTSFINLCGVIKTVELRNTTDESLLARFEFMPVEEFEETIRKKLQGLCCEGLGWNARNDYKVCRVKIFYQLPFYRFKNLGFRKIKIEESLRQLFSEYGIGPFSPKSLTKSLNCLIVISPGIITAIIVCSALQICLITLFNRYRYGLQNIGNAAVITLGMIVNIGVLLPCLCVLLPLLSRREFKNTKFIRQFSEREEVSEDGIIFFIKNEFLEQCSEMLERMSFQVEEIGVDELLCKFITSPTDSLPIGDYELRTIEVVDEEGTEEKSSENDEYSDKE